MLKFKTFVDKFIKTLPDHRAERPPENPYFIVEFWSSELGKWGKWHSPLKVIMFGPRANYLSYVGGTYANEFRYEDYWQIDHVVKASVLTGRILVLRIKQI